MLRSIIIHFSAVEEAFVTIMKRLRWAILSISSLMINEVSKASERAILLLLNTDIVTLFGVSRCTIYRLTRISFVN